MTIEDASWPAVILTGLGLLAALCKWLSGIIDRLFTQWLAAEETRRKRIERGTELINTLETNYDSISDSVRQIEHSLESEDRSCKYLITPANPDKTPPQEIQQNAE